MKTTAALRNLWRFGQRTYPGVDGPPVSDWRYYLSSWLSASTRRRQLLTRSFIRCVNREPWLQHLIRAEARTTFVKAVLAGAAAGLWLALQ